jgi:hypothetical protein
MLGRIARRTTVVSALSLASVIGLAFGCRTAAPLGGSSPRHDRATLSVENDDFYDRVIFVTMDGTRQRLGIATGATTTYFVIPAPFVLGSPDVRFVADVIGGSRPEVSQRTQVAPGDTVVMMIEAM